MQHVLPYGNATTTLAAVGLLAASSCIIGGDVMRVSTVDRPYGAHVVVTLSPKYEIDAVRGELMIIDHEAMLLVTPGRPGRVVRVPRAAAVTVSITNMREWQVTNGIPWKVEETLRRVSRYPQGLTPERLRRVLDFYGQQTVREVTP